MSITTSLLNACRYSKASRATRTTASGSSPLTWKIGAWIIRATSVLYTLDLEYCGDVVNPTWLLTTMCTVPPVRYPRSWDRFSVSATTPWPANAASPWTSTASTVNPGSPMSSTSCFARTTPSATGSTASKWLGLATSEVAIDEPSAAVNTPSAPRWYLTSPEPWVVRGSRLPSNSPTICA